jgi:hypothetical protein
LTSLTPSGEPADGTSLNQGQAVVTENGTALENPQIVKFVFTKGKASFDTNTPGVQGDSDKHTLYVKTCGDRE